MNTPETRKPIVYIPGTRPAFMEPHGARAPTMPQKITRNTFFCCWLFGYYYENQKQRRQGCCWLFGYRYKED